MSSPSFQQQQYYTDTDYYLLASTLETWCHELLYVRRVYDYRGAAAAERSHNSSSSILFTNTLFLGIPCHACRHPAVCQYIQETIHVAVSAILLQQSNNTNHPPEGLVVEELSFCVLKNHFDTVEQFVIVMNHLDAVDNNNNDEEQGTKRQHLLERQMRQLILSVQSLERYKSPLTKQDEDATFKISLRMKKTTDDYGSSNNGNAAAAAVDSSATTTTTAALSKAMNEGKWHSPINNDAEITIKPTTSDDGTPSQSPQQAGRRMEERTLHSVYGPGLPNMMFKFQSFDSA